MIDNIHCFRITARHLWHFEYMEKTLQWEASLLEVQMRQEGK